jgi:hypothetical protein
MVLDESCRVGFVFTDDGVVELSVGENRPMRVSSTDFLPITHRSGNRALLPVVRRFDASLFRMDSKLVMVFEVLWSLWQER